MRKPMCVLIALALAAAFPCGAVSAGTGPVSAAAELASGDWTSLAKRYPMPYFFSSDGNVTNAPSPEVLATWWDVLGDETLSQLIRLALEGNRDLAASRAKFREARAALGISEAAVLPWFDASTSLTNSKTGAEASSSGSQVGPRDYYKLGIAASWEIDIFGGKEQKIRASAADLQAQYGALHAAWVQLSSEVALNYLSLRTLQRRLQVAESNLALQLSTLGLLQSQYDSGLKDQLALSQAKYTMEQTRSSIPPLRASVEQTMNRMAILVGRVPGSLGKMLGDKPLPKLETSALVGIPANLLRRRPDIFAAERSLAAQMARKKAAEKDLLPKFNLLGAIGWGSYVSTGGLFSSGGETSSIGPAISLPIFHGGAIRNNIKAQTAKEEQLLAAYEQTVLNAVAEVRDALTAETQERERNVSLRRGVEAAKTARAVAYDQYVTGLSAFNNVIIAQTAQLSLEEQLAISDGQMLANIVRLFKALGGGWAPMTAESALRLPEGVDGGAVAPAAPKQEEPGGTKLTAESRAYLDQIRKDAKKK